MLGTTWDETLRRVYFRLAERFGKAAAERFFPPIDRPAKGAASDPEPMEPDPEV